MARTARILRSKPQPSSPARWPIPMVVKRSGIEGRGLFTVIDLRPRQKLGEYQGQLISRREGRRRARHQKKITIVEVNNNKAIDGATQQNGFRFINHSCTPNTFMRIIGERAEFYARHAIKAGTELTLDYKESHHDGKLPCACRSPACRGFL